MEVFTFWILESHVCFSHQKEVLDLSFLVSLKLNQSNEVSHHRSLLPQPQQLSCCSCVDMTNHFAPKVTAPCPLRQRAWDILSALSVESETRSKAAMPLYRKKAYLSTNLKAASRKIIRQGGHRPHSRSSWPCQSLENTVYSVTKVGSWAQVTKMKF